MKNLLLGFFMIAGIVSMQTINAQEYPITVDDREEGFGNNQFEYVGTWKLNTQPTPGYMTTDHWSDVAESYYQVRFNGTRIEVYGDKASWISPTAFSIDGGAEITLALAASPAQYGVLLYSSPFLPPGDHILKVRVKDEGSHTITVDKVVIYNDAAPEPIVVDDRVEGFENNQFEYVGNWNISTPPLAYMQTDHWTSEAEAYYQVRFKGSIIEVYGDKAYWISPTAFSIDGGEEVTVELVERPAQIGVLLWRSPTLNYADHILKVRVKDEESHTVTVDKVIIYSTASVATSNNYTKRDLIEVKMYPNPAQNFLTIDASEYPELTDYTIKILNLAGVSVYEKRSSQQSNSINLDRINKGMYFVQIHDSSNKVRAIKKLIIQ